jgi:hypothetical protein
MIRQEWNALQVGDHVFVHEETDRQDGDRNLPAVPGRVVVVDFAEGSNRVAIRISPARGKATVVLPRRLAVHLEELDPDRRCWRCDTHARAGTD